MALHTPTGPRKTQGGVRVELSLAKQLPYVVVVAGHEHDGFRLIREGCVPTKTRSRQGEGEASIGRGSHTKIQSTARSSSPVVAAGPAAAGASNPNKTPVDNHRPAVAPIC